MTNAEILAALFLAGLIGSLLADWREYRKQRGLPPKEKP